MRSAFERAPVRRQRSATRNATRPKPSRPSNGQQCDFTKTIAFILSRIRNNSAKRRLASQNPYSVNLATNATRIKTGTTWRTIQTWYYRYKNHGITGMTNGSRSDKGKTRKITPEELLEAINAAKPHFQGRRDQQAGLVSLLHRRRDFSDRDQYRPDHLLPLRPRVRTARPREPRTDNKKTIGLQHEIRQPTLASRHHVWTLT